MKIRNRTYITYIKTMLSIVCLCFLVRQGIDIKAAQTRKPISIEASVGFGQSVKCNRFVNVWIDIDNKGDSFSGYLQAHINGTESRDNCVYQIEVNLKREKQTKLNMVLPALEGINSIIFQLVDKDGVVVAKDTENIEVDNNMDMYYLGIIGENADYIKYISQDSFKCIELPISTIPETPDGLDAFDGIYIGVEFINKQSAEKLETVKEWNMEGRTIVLGCKSKTILEYLSIDQDSGVMIRDKYNQVIYTTYQHENGVVIEWNYSNNFFDTIKQSSEYARLIINEMQTSFAFLQFHKMVQESLTEESAKNNLIGSLQTMDIRYLPNVVGYAVILIIYILSIGPGLFILFRKMKKLLYYYPTVLVIVFFTICIIVLEGKNTIIKSPVVNTISVLNYEDRSNQVQEESYISIVLPDSETKSFSVQGQSKINLENLVVEKINADDVSCEDGHNIFITQKETSTDIEIRNSFYMKPYIFKVKSNQKAKGQVDYELKLDGSKLTGYVKNQLGYDLQDVILLSNYRMIAIGDLKQNEVYQLSGGQTIVHPFDLQYKLPTYIKQFTNLKEATNQKDLLNLRKFVTMAYCLSNKCIAYNNDTYLVGFVANDNTTQLEDTASDGSVEMVVYHMNQVQKNYEGMFFLNDISEFEDPISGEYHKITREMATNCTIINVYIPAKYRLHSLIYNNLLNKDKTFHGTISIYNNITKQYDLLFDEWGNQFQKEIDQDMYISSNDRITIRYESFDEKSNIMPILSATLEVK